MTHKRQDNRVSPTSINVLQVLCYVYYSYFKLCLTCLFSGVLHLHKGEPPEFGIILQQVNRPDPFLSLQSQGTEMMKAITYYLTLYTGTEHNM